VSEPQLRVVEDPAGEVAAMLAEAAGAGGHVVLTGGSSPRRAYEQCAERDDDWSSATVWFGDERCVPPAHPDSNFAMADRALLSRLSKPPTVMRMQGELDPDAAAGAYEADVRERLGGDPRWDLLLLGIGPDGHTASLFPNAPALEEQERRAVAVPHEDVERVTMTLPMLSAAAKVLYLVLGESKAEAARQVFSEEPSPEAPASLLRSTEGETIALLDRAAAAELDNIG
jgi:6-phosphogluconolactonase